MSLADPWKRLIIHNKLWLMFVFIWSFSPTIHQSQSYAHHVHCTLPPDWNLELEYSRVHTYTVYNKRIWDRGRGKRETYGKRWEVWTQRERGELLWLTVVWPCACLGCSPRRPLLSTEGLPHRLWQELCRLSPLEDAIPFGRSWIGVPLAPYEVSVYKQSLCRGSTVE